MRKKYSSASTVVNEFFENASTEKITENEKFKIIKASSTYKLYTTPFGNGIILKLVSIAYHGFFYDNKYDDLFLN